ncbi:MAG TPA: hypothetical protein DEP48_03915 [Persephonella sp.]|uniref:Flagellar FliJ protein n=1 Tax=Persephonella marina (strain DSM 14350 / EX-H1) TaxID=123214 RepID=C0QQG8_PERMH|nr:MULTISPECIES: hypothetical protein [Persephonella]ACO03197.1 conserved hypothetical protein [Persephonella marina EX-H1]HCB69480.1 hypothetical protein [Persephonella sp.]
MKILELFKKKLKFDIRVYRTKIDQIDRELADLISGRNMLYERYERTKNESFSDVNTLHYKIEYLKKLEKEILSIDEKIKVLEMKKEAVKLQIKLKNAEKKSVEKYIKNINRDALKKELKKEIQIAETSYNNRR